MSPDLYNSRELAAGRLLPRHVTALTRHYQEARGLQADGLCGPITRSDLDSGGIQIPLSPLLAMWLKVCREEIGKGEAGQNNAGPDVDRYRFGRTRGLWCAYFLSWTLVEACGRLGVECPVKPTGGARHLFRQIRREGKHIERPRLGAVVLFDRGKVFWKAHIEIVSHIEPDGGGFRTIAGNVGKFPSRVREYTREMGEPRLEGFAILDG